VDGSPAVFPARRCGEAGDQGRFVNGEALTSPAQ
jgi:hypothetical protein